MNLELYETNLVLYSVKFLALLSNQSQFEALLSEFEAIFSEFEALLSEFEALFIQFQASLRELCSLFALS